MVRALKYSKFYSIRKREQETKEVARPSKATMTLLNRFINLKEKGTRKKLELPKTTKPLEIIAEI
jgi:hypothetical protein